MSVESEMRCTPEKVKEVLSGLRALVYDFSENSKEPDLAIEMTLRQAVWLIQTLDGLVAQEEDKVVRDLNAEYCREHKEKLLPLPLPLAKHIPLVERVHGVKCCCPSCGMPGFLDVDTPEGGAVEAGGIWFNKHIGADLIHAIGWECTDCVDK